MSRIRLRNQRRVNHTYDRSAKRNFGVRRQHMNRYCALPVYMALLGSCSAPGVKVSLMHSDPHVRVQALIKASEEQRVDLFPEVLTSLRNRDGAVRLVSGVVARKLSGQDVKFKPFGSTEEQERAIERWHSWWEKEINRGGVQPLRTRELTPQGVREQ